MNHGSPTTRPQRHLQPRAVPSSIQPIICHAHRSALRVVHFQPRQVLARHHQQSRLLCIDIPRSSHPRPGLDQQVPFRPSPRRLQTSPCTRDARLTLAQRSKGARVPIPYADPPSASPPFAFNNILPGLIHGQPPPSKTTPPLANKDAPLQSSVVSVPSILEMGHARLGLPALSVPPRPQQTVVVVVVVALPKLVWRRVKWLRALDDFEVVPSPSGRPPISHV